MRKNWLLDRRTLLKAAGVSVALPYLEVMGAGEKKEQAPQRFVTLYFPNGVYPGAWESSGAGKSFKLGKVLEPMNPLKDKVMTVNNLFHPGGHIKNALSFLNGYHHPNGQRINKSKVSIDQIIAKKYQEQSFLPSLHLGVEAALQGFNGPIAKSHGSSISRSQTGYKIEPELSPSTAFDSLFGHRVPGAKKAINRQKNIVDSVWTQAKYMSKKVSKNDQSKMAQYFESLRSVELKLNKTLTPPKKTWYPKSQPNLEDYKMTGQPESHEEYVKLMLDLILLGLWTDTTRVATMMYGVSISQLNYNFLKGGGNHHAKSHHRGEQKGIDGYNNISRWFVKMSYELMKKMDEVDEGNGTLLDNSLVLLGSGLSDGNVHDMKNIPLLIGGGAGGKLKTGRVVNISGDHKLADLLLTILHKFDIKETSLHGHGKTVLRELA